MLVFFLAIYLNINYNINGDNMFNLLIKFIEYLKYERHYSNNTIMAYDDNISKFLEYLDSIKINDIKDIEYQTIRKYINELYNKKYSAKSICRHISSLRSFFKYLLNNNYIKNNPMSLITNPKIEKKLPKYINYEDIEKILNYPDIKTDIGIRDSLILELLYVTGIRVSELANINLKDINNYDKTINILGKGSKERVVMYGTRCQELLDKYIKIRSNFIKEPIDYLILSKRGKQINTREIRKIINDISKSCHIDMNISPHTFRHTFATHMLNEGADLRSVQKLLGHENLSTTTIYTHLSNEKLRREYLKAHPRAQ